MFTRYIGAIARKARKPCPAVGNGYVSPSVLALFVFSVWRRHDRRFRPEGDAMGQPTYLDIGADHPFIS